MKFTNGFWHFRNGIEPHFPGFIYEVENTANELIVHASTNNNPHRGATLNCPMLEVKMSSPLPNIVRVQCTRHKGGKTKKPAFEIASTNPSVLIESNGTSHSLQSGELKVTVSDNPWKVEFTGNDTHLTSSDFRNLGHLSVNRYEDDHKVWIEEESDRPTYMKEELALGVGENVYGMGERFTPFVKNGQSLDIWHEDGGTASEQSYKNIPFYLSNKGYGVFVNHPERVSFEVASEKVSRVGFAVPGETLDYFIIYGPDPKSVLENYTALTGRPPLPPVWSFGLWLTTSFTTDYDEATVTGFVQGMEERNLPLHVFHFDCFWMRGFHWCDFEWDPAVFPDPEGMLKRLKDRGLKICVWINPYIAQRSCLFDEGMEKGYFVKRPNGDVWQWDMWQAGMALVDFTNPEACEWYADKLRTLVDMGVDSFKTDFGERIPTNVVYHDGSDPQKMHNYYTQMYNKCVFEVLETKLGKDQAALFARSATAGGQKYPVHWGGDCEATYESMAESLRGGLSLGLSGFGFWSHDIGGFESTASPDIYKRWIAFGLLSSHSRLHGSSSYRVPWLYDEESVTVLRHFTNLKCSLMPYIMNVAVEAKEKGIPVLRALLLEYPDNPTCHYLDRQYMLGSDLLVSPVFNKDGTAEYYLPAGIWTNVLNGKKYEGETWIKEQHDFLSVPLMARPGSVIAVGHNKNTPDYAYDDSVTLCIYEPAENMDVTVDIPDTKGALAAQFKVTCDGNNVSIKPVKADKPWKAVISTSVNGVEKRTEGISQSSGESVELAL